MKRMSLVLGIILLFVALVPAPRAANAARTALPAGFTRVALGSGLSGPTAMDFWGNKIYVSEKGGAIRIIRENGTLKPAPFHTLSVNTLSERGLLGIALSPNFGSDRIMYVYYTTGTGAKKYSGSPENRVSRLKKSKNGPIKEKILLDHIPSTNGNHNGGDIHIGFDGKLWISVGESGCCPNDAQGLTTVRGKILRINLDGTIPSDNPFFNTPNARQETWAYGFRNPWRFAMRQSNQSYVVADVGSGTWEEIDSLGEGNNYGWPMYEGPCPSSNLACNPNTVDYAGTVPPIHWYNHGGAGEVGNVIAGGVFAENANNYPAPYAGAYFYGDTGGDWVNVITLDGNNAKTGHYEFDDNIGSPVAFGNGPDGNVYVASHYGGVIYKYIYTAP